MFCFPFVVIIWQAGVVLRQASVRLLNDQDYSAVHAVLAADPVANCMVSARVEVAGLDPWRLGGELWAADSSAPRVGKIESLCFSGPNLIPLGGDLSAIRSFADRALRQSRVCSSIVGPAELVLDLWDELSGEWGPAREVRPDQPLLALAGSANVSADSAVRAVRPEELDQYLPAAIAMFTEEVGIDPRRDDDGVGYRARVAELIQNGHAFARFQDGEVIFKAEIGALSTSVGQIQGVWVHPEFRGQGLGTAGTAALANRLVRGMGRTASLYANSYNEAALSTYRAVGFRQVGCYATVLF